MKNQEVLGSKSKTLLIVDDEESIRRLYQLEFEDEGYNVILASNGREAFEKIEKENPDLVVLDIRMEQGDGIEFLDKITETGKKPPIVISSAYTDYRWDLTTWAADAYVVKSSDLSELKLEVKNLLIRSEAEGQSGSSGKGEG